MIQPTTCIIVSVEEDCIDYQQERIQQKISLASELVFMARNYYLFIYLFKSFIIIILRVHVCLSQPMWSKQPEFSEKL